MTDSTSEKAAEDLRFLSAEQLTKRAMQVLRRAADLIESLSAQLDNARSELRNAADAENYAKSLERQVVSLSSRVTELEGAASANMRLSNRKAAIAMTDPTPEQAEATAELLRNYARQLQNSIHIPHEGAQLIVQGARFLNTLASRATALEGELADIWEDLGEARIERDAAQAEADALRSQLADARARLYEVQQR